MDPVQLLSAEFSRRSQRNPRYSLRAYARSMGLSHTVLSLVLSGKRPLSKKAALKVSAELALEPKEAAALMARTGRAKAHVKPGDYALVDLETFHLISDWLSYGILSLTEIPHASFAPRALARRFHVNELQARLAFERLVKLGLLAKTGGRWRQTGKSIKVENDVSTAYTRKFHRQLLDKAAESLENDPIERRDFSSITFAMDQSQVAYAKERIRQFRRELCAELEAKGPPTDVYNLTVQIYPVTQGENP